ncbi:hypothetical protein [Limosilactobacillus reuteri]|uniref:hypothetical protein n=1 Tax=Limosilactobacillus reuteri TaxID=1598 RepID=UPI0039956EB0
MKIIDFEEVKAIAEEMSPSEWYKWVDTALRNKEKFQMPPKIHITQNNGGYFNVMPAVYNEKNMAIVKMVGRHLLKPGERRSVMMSDMMIYESDTGILRGTIDGEYITTLRTGVVAAHSALLFAKENFKEIGLIGLGNIMTVCFKTFISKLRNEEDNRKLIVKLYKHHGQEKRFAERFSNLKDIKFVFCDSYEEVMTNSDIILSAVTKVTENFAADNCYKKGVTIVPICTMGFQNCDLFFDKIFTDEIDQIRGFKYFDSFKSVTNVTDVLNGKSYGRQNDNERILVYDYGLAIHDLYFAYKFFNLAKGKSVDYEYPKEKYFI